MAEQEYFVRNPDSEDARGPFSLDKLASLAEAGQISKESLLYDERTETWLAIADDAHMSAKLFPERQKLTLRSNKKIRHESAAAQKEAEAAKGEKSDTAKKTEASAEDPASGEASENAEISGTDENAEAAETGTGETEAPPEGKKPEKNKAPVEEEDEEEQKSELSGLDVEDLLVAAEGNTKEMEILRRQKKWREKTASLAPSLMALVMLASAVGQLLTQKAAINNLLTDWSGFYWRDWMPLFEAPHMVLGVLDLLLAILLALSATSTYPVLRLRMFFGLGYMGWIAFAHYAAGSVTGIYEMAGLALLAVGIFICTLTLRYKVLITSGLGAFAGAVILGLVWNLPKIFQ